MGDERWDDGPEQHREDDYSSARIGAAAALTLVLVVLLVLDVAVQGYDISPGILLPLLGAILALQGVEVLRVLKGSLADSSVILRTPGGVADGVEVVYEDWPTLKSDKHYLAFLRVEETPTMEGSEKMWTLVWAGHGLFSVRDDAWANLAGKTTSDYPLP